jgi:hypothetical protein
VDWIDIIQSVLMLGNAVLLTMTMVINYKTKKLMRENEQKRDKK